MGQLPMASTSFYSLMQNVDVQPAHPGTSSADNLSSHKPQMLGIRLPLVHSIRRNKTALLKSKECKRTVDNFFTVAGYDCASIFQTSPPVHPDFIRYPSAS